MSRLLARTELWSVWLLGSRDRWWSEEQWSRSVEQVRGLAGILPGRGQSLERDKQLGKEVGYLARGLRVRIQPAEQRLWGRQGTAAEEDNWVCPFLYTC
jgi:hypothetical protein